jgi:GntR family transcriptional regulator
MMGVSRATLREGMRSFEGKGLIRRRQGVGTFVVPQAKVIETGWKCWKALKAGKSDRLSVSMGELEIKKSWRH